MNNLKSFLIFIAISLAIYTCLNLYVFFRAFRALSPTGFLGLLAKIAFILLYLSYPLALTLGRKGIIGKGCLWVGSFWLGAMAYGVLIALVIDILILSNFSLHWFPVFIVRHKILTGRTIVFFATLLILFTLIGGYINSLNPIVRRIQLKLGNYSSANNYTIVAFSDTHLGALVGIKRLEKIVELTNMQNPDLILIIGDLVDESGRNVEWVIEPLKQLKAEDGVWMVAGNHEFYHGIVGITKLVREANITLLRNEVREIAGKINLIGIDDITGARQFRTPKTSINDLTTGLNRNLPTILLHHTPLRREEAARAGSDLMLSGHTHAGQLWPFGELAKATYKIPPGLSKIGKMQFYLSVGAGTWGPPIRIGSRPEVVNIDIECQEKTTY